MQSTKPWLAEFCLAICLIATLPLLVLQSIHLWDRPHFQFFPLAWAACVFFIYTSGQIQSSTHPWRQRLGVACWGVGLVAIAAAAMLFSPWIGQAAAILCITGWGLMRLESVPLFRWLGWTLLLWITLPLPDNLDSDVVNGLQRLSAQSASQLLDLVGILHLRQGTVLEIRSRQLFVDEACSGIDSLYSLIAISLLMMLWQQRPLIVGLCTLVTVPLWAWLGNVLRLLLIAVLLDRWQIDLSEGWPHTLLGLATFALSSLCLLCTLSGFAILFQRFSSRTMPDDRQWHLFYNAAVCFPGQPPAVQDETDQYFGMSAPPPAKQTPAATRPLKQPPTWVTMTTLFVVSALSLVVNLRSTSRDWIDGRSSRLPHYTLTAVDQALGESDFPDTLQQAKRVRFHPDQRSPESFFGEYSRSWSYRDSRCEFVLSVDFPFRGYHPLWVCYTNAGHQIQGSPTSILMPNQANGERPHVVYVKLRDDIGNFSYLWFELFDREGQPVAVKNYDQPEENAIWTRMKMVLSNTVARDPVSYQFQLYVPSSRELTEAELKEYAQIFVDSAPLARQLVQKLPK